MKNTPNQYSNITSRENFLILLLNRIIKEYRALLTHIRHIKPFKIIEIIYISSIPGESKFTIQVSNKNSIVTLTAAEIISNGYDLNNFNFFHSEMIRQAAQGKLIEFLKLSEPKSTNKIISKRYDRDLQQFIFTIKTKDKVQFSRTADELANDKKLLTNMDINDIYDICYTSGAESILKEKTMLLLAKHQNINN